MVLFNVEKDRNFDELQVSPGATLGDTKPVTIEADNYWRNIFFEVTKGTLSGGSSPAFTATAGDKLVKKLSMNLGGTIEPITGTSVENLKRLSLLEFGEEVLADGYWDIPFFGAFPAFMFRNGVKFTFEHETLANLTTGSPTSQSGTTIKAWLRQFPRQGELKPGQIAGFPIIKTVEKDLVSVAGRKKVANLNTGNLLRHAIIIPSSTTLINNVEVSLADGEDVLRKHTWSVLKEQNKRDYFLDAKQTDWVAYTFPNLPTDEAAIGRLDLWADINSEGGGKITLVTLEHMPPVAYQAIVKKLVG